MILIDGCRHGLQDGVWFGGFHEGFYTGFDEYALIFGESDDDIIEFAIIACGDI